MSFHMHLFTPCAMPDFSGSAVSVKMPLKVVIFGRHSVTVKFIHRISFETNNTLPWFLGGMGMRLCF